MSANEQIKELLSSKEGKLRINEMFSLNWYVDNRFGSPKEFLELEMQVPKKYSYKIDKRNANDIVDAIAYGIEYLMQKYSKELQGKIKGGRI